MIYGPEPFLGLPRSNIDALFSNRNRETHLKKGGKRARVVESQKSLGQNPQKEERTRS